MTGENESVAEGESKPEDKSKLEGKSKLTASREAIIVQLQEQIGARTNIIIASNAFLFVPLISALTGATPLSGYLLWLPIGICSTGIVLNLFWLYSTFGQIRKRDSLITAFGLNDYFKFTPTKEDPNAPNPATLESSFYDFFNKASPILMFIVWLFFLGFILLQHPPGTF